jgi:glucokinase
MILAGDVGGTNTRIAFFAPDELHRPQFAETFPSRDHGGLEEIVRAFVSRREIRVSVACVGVAGPVRDGRCEATNLPWIVDSRSLAKCLALDSASVINDLEANAYGLASLGPEDFVTLNAGADGAHGNAAVVSAGTGLGEAGVYWDGKRHHPFACEGGHTNFAPTTDLEVELLRWLQKAFGHVSWERVVSGPGLLNLYRFLRDSGRAPESPALAEEMKKGDPGAVISRHALAKDSDLCVQALDFFVRLYGAEAGNAALKFMASGGVFLGGGIAPRNIEKMKDGTFLSGFLDKGRMRPLLEGMPVRIILNQLAALLGAARFAAECGGES